MPIAYYPQILSSDRGERERERDTDILIGIRIEGKNYLFQVERDCIVDTI